jgi:hypothetical protein
VDESQLKILACLPVLVPALCMGADTARRLLCPPVFSRLLALTVGIGIGGWVLLRLGVVDQPKALIAFFAPCLQLCFLRFAHYTFKKYAGRWPMDVVFNWSRGLVLDRAFAFFTTVPALLIPVLLMGRL